MHSHHLATNVETFHQRWREENPLFAEVNQGRFTNDMAGKYLQSILYVISHTPVHLKKAVEVCEAKNLTELAEFFRDKLKEEEGHDEWAIQDLEVGGHQYQQDQVTKTVIHLIDYLGDLIEKDPTLYIPYIVFAEYFTVLAGPELVDLLSGRCGLPKEQFTVIDNHATLDKEHIKHDFHCIDQVIPKSYTTNDLMQILDRSCSYYDSFCREVIGQ